MDLITTGGSGGSSEYSLAAINGAGVFCSDNNPNVAGRRFAYSNSDNFTVSNKDNGYLTCNKSGTYKLTLDITARYSSASIKVNNSTVLSVNGSTISFMNAMRSGEITQVLSTGDSISLNLDLTHRAEADNFFSVLGCANIYEA